MKEEMAIRDVLIAAWQLLEEYGFHPEAIIVNTDGETYMLLDGEDAPKKR